jgi:hypothetical protein
MLLPLLLLRLCFLLLLLVLGQERVVPMPPMP